MSTATGTGGAVRSPAPSRHAQRTLAVAGMAVLVTFLDTTILFVAFPSISAAFSGASASSLSWVLNAYTITFAALLVPAGKLADRVGHKRIFLLGTALFTFGSAACAVAPTIGLLNTFRVIQAMGAAAVIPASLALVMRAFPRDRLPVAVAIWGAMGAAAGAVGPTLGAVIVDSVGWRWVFLINVPIGIGVVLVGLRVLQESTDPDARIPALLGVVLIAAAAALASLAVVQTSDWGWIDPRTLGALALSLVLLAVFVAHQRRTSAPVLDLELLSIPDYRWANAATFAFGIAFTAMFLGSLLFLEEVWGFSTLKAGLGVTPGPLLVAILAPRFGQLAGRVGQRPLLLLGGLVFAAAGLWRVVALSATPAYLRDFLPSMVLTGIGVALVLPQLASTVAQALPPNRGGVGGGANQAIRQFGGTLGVAFTLALVVQRTAGADLGPRFDQVWLLLFGGGVLTSAAALGLTRRAVVTPEPVAADLVVAD
ncbi:DHA2 family efflux MFS transporter permease subunit [Aquihabitans sp. McL0605]|uniref:DHA2 family efflux MFS transporter permease subunit n=1 Tax=Aquihabitans sp. McL0605 TaxID=3415671 RepID=UPI003CF75C72